MRKWIKKEEKKEAEKGNFFVYFPHTFTLPPNAYASSILPPLHFEAVSQPLKTHSCHSDPAFGGGRI
jgi:hypothetical protein